MKVLIVGGTGMIGAYTALHLREQGNDVTVAARNALGDESPVETFRSCSVTTPSRPSPSSSFPLSTPLSSPPAKTCAT